MDRSEAKDILNYDIRQYTKQYEDATDEDFEALDLAIKALGQTESEDCISRQHAVKDIKNHADTITDALIILENFPPVTPIERTDWIPVSEKLPKKDGRYQVTRYDYVTNTEFIDILWYEENIWWDRYSTGDYAVTAWKPLPEPYKESEE